MITTSYTTWGSDTIAVSANWADPSPPIQGDAQGRQVADCCHEREATLRAALEWCAGMEELPEDEAQPLIEAALAKAVHADTYLASKHDLD